MLADIVHDVVPYNTNPNASGIVHQDQSTLSVYGKIYNLFDLLFIHSKSNCEQFLSLYPVNSARVFEIPHGTSEIFLEIPTSHTRQSLCEELSIPSERSVILFFGTITKYKGVEDLIQAFSLIRQQTNSQLVIAGYPAKDVNVDSLKKLAESTGAAGQISWYLDYIPNDMMAPLINLASIVVLPYRAITQSGILQIAYACGKPVVGTKVGGLPDVIEDGKSGLLAEPANPESLADAMRTMLLDTDKTHEMGKYAKHLSQTIYSWDNTAKLILAAYNKRVKEQKNYSSLKRR